MTSIALSRSTVRRVDEIAQQRFGISGLVLMENAGRGCAEQIAAISREVSGGDHAGEGNSGGEISREKKAGDERATLKPALPIPVTILCGKGNNAGDGYVIARHLQWFAVPLTLVPLVAIDQLGGDARVNAEIAQKAGISIVSEPNADELQRLLFASGVIVDCMLGTGALGAPREPFATAVRIANHADAIRIAIDIPTGLDCDTGEVAAGGDGDSDEGIVFHADHTLTLVASKLGFERSPRPSSLGKVQVIPIGIPPQLLDELAVSPVKA